MNKLHTINAEDLQNRTYEPTHFLVDELIPEGLHILAGAPKIGKSWLALWLCLCVSQGQPLWGFATTQGEVLYLSLEDSFQRIQTRLFDLTEDAPPVRKFFQKPDVLIVICVQIAVTAYAADALQSINDNQFCTGVFVQKLLDLLLQTVF